LARGPRYNTVATYAIKNKGGLNRIYLLLKVENLTSNYAAALGFYRFFYILSW